MAARFLFGAGRDLSKSAARTLKPLVASFGIVKLLTNTSLSLRESRYVKPKKKFTYESRC